MSSPIVKLTYPIATLKQLEWVLITYLRRVEINTEFRINVLNRTSCLVWFKNPRAKALLLPLYTKVPDPDWKGPEGSEEQRIAELPVDNWADYDEAVAAIHAEYKKPLVMKHVPALEQLPEYRLTDPQKQQSKVSVGRVSVEDVVLDEQKYSKLRVPCKTFMDPKRVLNCFGVFSTRRTPECKKTRDGNGWCVMFNPLSNDAQVAYLMNHTCAQPLMD